MMETYKKKRAANAALFKNMIKLSIIDRLSL